MACGPHTVSKSSIVARVHLQLQPAGQSSSLQIKGKTTLRTSPTCAERARREHSEGNRAKVLMSNRARTSHRQVANTALGCKVTAHFAIDMTLTVALGTSVPKDIVGLVTSLVGHFLDEYQNFCSGVEQTPLVQNLGVMDSGAVEGLNGIGVKERPIRRGGVFWERRGVGLLRAASDLVLENHQHTAGRQTGGAHLTIATV